MHNFFFPKSIAVIGATANPRKFGNAVTINILKNKNLESELFLVTQKSNDILGLKCYKSILDVPKDVDLAIILVPAKAVDGVIDQCIEKQVKCIIIVTAGFGEINQEGKKAEKRIAEKCTKVGIRWKEKILDVQNSLILEIMLTFLLSKFLNFLGKILTAESFVFTWKQLKMEENF